MADTLTRSHGAEGLRLLDGTVPGWLEQHGITSQPAAEPSPARKTISRMSAPARPSVRMDSAGEMNGSGGSPSGGRYMMEYARKLAAAQARAGVSAPMQTVGESADVRSMRPSGSMQRHSEGSAAPSIRRASAVGGGGAGRPSIRRASAASSVTSGGGVHPRPSIRQGSQGSGATLMGGGAAYATISRLSAASGAAATRQQDDDQEDQPRLRWRRVGRVFNALGADAAPGADAGPSVNDVNQDVAPVPSVGEDRAALMRRISALAVAEDAAAAPPATLPQPPPLAAELLAEPQPQPARPVSRLEMVQAYGSVRSDSASSHDDSLELLKVYQQSPEEGGMRHQADWRPVLAVMALSPQQKRATADARAALDQALRELHVKRAALYKTLCSFATTEADDGLETAIFDCKQELVSNEGAEAEELRAFRYHVRSALAGPLLRARPAIAAAAPGAAPDFLALTDMIVVELASENGGGSGGAPHAPPPPMRRRSCPATNANTITEDEEGEAEA